MNEQVNNEDRDFFSMLLSFRGVINRQEYLIYGIIFPILLMVLGFHLASRLPEGKGFLLFVLLGAIAQLATTIKRARDRQENIVILIIALLVFSPMVILYLLFAPTRELEEGKNKKSRVLLYILLGITLLTILGLVLPKIMDNSQEDVREQLVCIQMKGISNALKMFKLDYNIYPSTAEEFNLFFPKYLKKIPTDSWGNEIKYIQTSDGFELISAGRDGIKSSDDILFSECQLKYNKGKK